MGLSTLFCRAGNGVHAPLVTVETHLTNGLPAFSIVGLAEMAVREARDRVRGALINSACEFPTRRITINLAPADLPKEGGRFDLAIAAGILQASNQLTIDNSENHELIGELALSGDLRPINGVLPVALAARRAGHRLVVPVENAAEAALVDGLEVIPIRHLLQLIEFFHTGRLAEPASIPTPGHRAPEYTNLASVKGQPQAKRALEIAAAGGHHLLMSGPPGAGKSLLASCLPGLLPPLSDEEALETAALHSISGREFDPASFRVRPFRQPHHTASGVALVGGGGKPAPGEISLAHNGILFLDELPEFSRQVLEVLREPLESGRITISRAARQANFPARFQLIAAMNPCPCGYHGDDGPRGCTCSAEQILRYRQRISGPIMDRIDLHIQVNRLSAEALTSAPGAAETSSQVRERVRRARDTQQRRADRINARLDAAQTEALCQPDEAARQLLLQAIDRLGLSGRAYHRVLRVARTIADLGGIENVGGAQIAEAIGYRGLDRTPAGLATDKRA